MNSKVEIVGDSSKGQGADNLGFSWDIAKELMQASECLNDVGSAVLNNAFSVSEPLEKAIERSEETRPSIVLGAMLGGIDLRDDPNLMTSFNKENLNAKSCREKIRSVLRSAAEELVEQNTVDGKYSVESGFAARMDYSLLVVQKIQDIPFCRRGP